MSNKILKFADFKNGNPLQEPKKHALTTKGEPKPKKEKSFDQVKRSNLGQLTVTQPDYSKTQKVDESVELTDLEFQIANVDVELTKLDPKSANYPTQKAELLNKKLELEKALDIKKTAPKP
jgi:hypothetical protein